MKASSHGLQHWIESKAATPAFLLAAGSVILRAAAFWSGGAINLPALLGRAGIAWFNGITGIGIAVGSELLASVFGRQRQRAKAEALEAMTRPRITKAERVTLAAHYEAQATIAGRFMALGIVASLIAAAFFLVTTTGAHTWYSIGADVLIACVLVTVMTAFGVFYEDRPDAEAGEVQMGQARTMRAGAVDAAGARIRSGEFTPQDVRLVSQALPRAERDAFEAALITDTPDDPMWSSSRLAAWLDCDDQAGRRRLQRQLSKLKDKGVGIVKDERTGYRIPQSVVAAYFSGEYLERHARAKSPTLPGRSHPSGPLAAAATADSDATATDASQDAELPRYVTNVAV